MKIHEYQGKAILKKYGVTVPRGTMATSREEAEAAARELLSSGATGVVVKAQIHAGGRGKGGGVKIAKSVSEAGELADKMLGMKLVTHQTGPEGRIVRRLLIEETLPIEKELVPRNSGGPRGRQAGVHGFGRGRNGNRAGGRGKSRCHSEAAHRSGHGPGGVSGAQDGFQAWAERQADQSRGAISFESLQGVSRHRCIAGRDQSLHHHHRRPAVRARCQADLRRQRALPASRHPRTARHYRRRSARGRGFEVQPELHQARRQRRAAW